MRELSIKIDCLCCDRDEFIKYFCLLDGIDLCDIDIDNEEIYVRYDSDKTSLEIIKMEILLFLDLLDIPSINGFNKHFGKELSEYRLVIKDLCCEYCLKSNIEELIMINGIESVSTDFDFINKKDVKLKIKYNKNILNKNDIIKLCDKFNT